MKQQIVIRHTPQSKHGNGFSVLMCIDYRAAVVSINMFASHKDTYYNGIKS